MRKRSCPICLAAADLQSLMPLTVFEIECDRCGRFQITHDLANWWRQERERLDGTLRAEEEALLPYLSAYTRQAAAMVRLDTTNWKGLAKLHIGVPVSRKRDRLLELIARRSSTPGAWIALNPRLTSPLLDIGDDRELDFLLDSLRDRGYVQFRRVPVPEARDDQGGFSESEKQYSLTMVGWELLEPIAGAGIPGTCFVAMSFDASLNSAFDQGIQPAVETDCGLRVIRVDREEHNDNITDRILAGIRSAQCMIADFTMQRQGVYFEAGFGVGLGRTVIWTCREDDFARVHFDTRQYNHIVWTDPADLRRKLADRLRATVDVPVQTRSEAT